jgi:general nucleoside transport system permease protein
MGIMTAAVSTPVGNIPELTREQRSRARKLGIGVLLLAVFAAVAFTRAKGSAKFLLEEGSSVSAPAGTLIWVAIVSLAAIGGTQLWRGFGRWTPVLLGLSGVMFITAFLSWAAAGRQVPLVGLLNATIGVAVPLALGALAGILCEQSGVINIAIEGMLLAGAFTSTLVGHFAGIAVGVVAAMVVSALLAWLLAWLAIRWKVDQVIAGFAINFLVLGMTSFFYSSVLSKQGKGYNDVTTVRSWAVPGLSDIPVVGPIVFDQRPLTYIAYFTIAAGTWFLYRTRWGLRTRAIGEHPKAADTLGVSVNKLRYRNVIIAGAVGGLGGTYWTMENGRFSQNITVGFGFIALAAVIIGRWHPVGATLGALLFAFFKALNNTIGNLNTGIPSELLLALPYVATIVVVAGFIGKARPPAAGGQPYESQ